MSRPVALLFTHGHAEGIERAVEVARAAAERHGWDLVTGEERGEHQPELCVVLGGDGTFISAIRWIQDTQIPVLGVNMGAFGFLTEAPVEQLFPVMDELIKGNLETEERILLSAKVIRDGQDVACQTILNDVVVNKEALPRIAHIHTFIDEDYLTTFKADGLIVSSPTGSTAYSLSAGGPIVAPTMDCIIVTPICPHTLAVRPLVISPGETITVRSQDPGGRLALTVDGQAGTDFSMGESVVVRQAQARVDLVRFPGQTFFSTLRQKLNWAIRPHGEG